MSQMNHDRQGNEPASLPEKPKPHRFDLVEHLIRQKAFSEHTFGPGTRTQGVIAHIRKELKEIEADPSDLLEWVDLILLAFDGAWRAGFIPEEIAEGIERKQRINEARDWPDWRTMDPTKPIEHIRLQLPSSIGKQSQAYASIEDLQAWAQDFVDQPADFTIRTREGDPYLRRWWVIPRSEACNVYLHEIVASDDDRALHDHPWDSTSMIIAGEYIEHTPAGSFLRKAGDVVSRKATDSHRIEIPEGGIAVSLFITGPKVRDWGFHCPSGWVLWSDFVDDADKGKIGRGCGESGLLSSVQGAD